MFTFRRTHNHAHINVVHILFLRSRYTETSRWVPKRRAGKRCMSLKLKNWNCNLVSLQLTVYNDHQIPTQILTKITFTHSSNRLRLPQRPFPDINHYAVCRRNIFETASHLDVLLSFSFLHLFRLLIQRSRIQLVKNNLKSISVLLGVSVNLAKKFYFQRSKSFSFPSYWCHLLYIYVTTDLHLTYYH